MKLVKVNPFYAHNGVDRLLNEVLNQGVNYDRFAKNELSFNPSANVFETKDAFRLELSIPGFDKEQVSISVENDLLVIKGEVKKAEQEYEYSRVEFMPQNFEKSFKISQKIDQLKIGASFKNGILEVNLPKKEEAVAVKREITVG
ncbi:Hsp20/alpha crystallin family protein [Sunxiuqinia sp. A32]|uniref:Hsp20/alpha crystallin family protein n=1 Tax=Sunxiuqinia sp. A32 TaxID=3461496 RepID=UPI0040467C9D